MFDIIRRFAVCGAPALCGPFGEGHINETYLVTCTTGLSYILQKISRAAFKHPDQLMSNISSVCSFLDARLDDRRASMHLVPTLTGESWYEAEDGGCWRMYEFVAGSVCLQKAERPEDLYKTALTFGRFQRYLSAFPADTLYETIPNFHNTPDRYRLFRAALEKDVCGRAASCRAEIDFALAHEAEADSITAAMRSGVLPVRVTHNDTKLNNILLDYHTREPLCVIDLDTVMPGSSLYDFGDLIRFGASTAAEDETDLSLVSVSLDLYKTAADGFQTGCGDMLTDAERSMLPIGAKLMTLECGLRFLTDYLSGDEYFHISRERHNLDRCRTQFKLVSDMEAKWDKLQALSR